MASTTRPSTPLPVDFNSRARIANLEVLANDLGVALATTVTDEAAAAESGPGDDGDICDDW